MTLPLPFGPAGLDPAEVWSVSDLNQAARGLLEQAISHDPNYAIAYSYVGLWYVFRIGEIGSPDPDGDAVAGSRYAAEAIERGGDDAFALALYGHAQSFLLHDLQKGKNVLERAIAACPSSAMAWTMFVIIFVFLRF